MQVTGREPFVGNIRLAAITSDGAAARAVASGASTEGHCGVTNPQEFLFSRKAASSKVRESYVNQSRSDNALCSKHSSVSDLLLYCDMSQYHAMPNHAHFNPATLDETSLLLHVQPVIAIVTGGWTTPASGQNTRCRPRCGRKSSCLPRARPA